MAATEKKLTGVDVGRMFIAKYLGSRVSKSGSIAGYEDWWKGATPYARRQLDRHYEAVKLKFERDERDAKELIDAALASMRESIQQYVPPESLPVKLEEVKALVALLVKTLRWRDPPKVVDLFTRDRPPEPKVDYSNAADERYFNRTRPPAARPATISPRPAPTATPPLDRPPMRRT